MRPLAAVALFLLLLAPALTRQAAGETVLHYWTKGRYGEVGGETLTPADGYAFSVRNTGRNQVNVSLSKPGTDSFYPLSMAAPTGADLVVGDYPLAADNPGPSNPMLEFQTAVGLGTGEFQILEISYDSNGEVLTLAADFAYHTDYTVAAYGSLRFNSSVPYLHPAGVAQFVSNFYRIHETAGALTVQVRRGDGSTGPLSVDYATTDGTYLAGRDYTPVSGTLTWADGDTADQTVTLPILNTHDPYLRDGTFSMRLGEPGAGPQAQTNVTVVKDSSPVTFIHIDAHRNDAGEDLPALTYSTADKHIVFGQYLDGAGFYFYAVGDYDGGFPPGTYDPKVEISFAPGYNQSALGVGDYPGALNDLSDDHPCLNLTGFYSSNLYNSGSFQVLEAEHDTAGNLTRFAANFAITTAGYSMALHGQVRFNSTVPLPPPVVRPQVSLEASVPTTVADGGAPGIFTLTRTGDVSQSLIVAFTVKGSAKGPLDYKTLPGYKTIKAGKSFTKIKVRPVAASFVGGSKKSVKLTLLPSNNYDLVTEAVTAKVRILPAN